MVNYQELLKILEYNNIGKASLAETVDNALNLINYSSADKQEALRFLKGQGWLAEVSSGPVSQEPQAMPEVKPAIQPDQSEMSVLPEAQPMIRPLTRDEQPVAAASQPESSGGGSFKKVLAIIFLFLLVLSGGGLLYAYIQKIGPFSFPKYSEENFFSGLLAKADEIHSASYTLSGNLDVSARDADARPFVVKEASNAAEMKKKYANDSARVEDISSIIHQLNKIANYNSYSGAEAAETNLYPETIVGLFADTENYYSYGGNSINDPVTGKNYDYRATDSGKNFALTVTFETDAAITAIAEHNDYGYGSGTEDKTSSTIIDGKKVTFTKDSPSYIYMASEPPKPFLASLSDSMKVFPDDINVKSSVSASSETNSDTDSDWRFNIDAEGDFGDLTYKINADALKKKNIYYLKINNFPSLFLTGDISLAKGKWVSISPAAPSDDKADDEYNYSLLSILKENITNVEKSFKENREKSIKLTKKAIAAADKTKLVSFKKEPKAEKVDGRELVRYELSLNKAAIVPFYTALQKEIDSDPDLSDYRDVIDQGLIDYLNSDEFDEVFDYLNKNNTFTLWTDTKGFPAVIENKMRIVPPDTATQLKGKQINIVFKAVIDNINEDLNIEAPTGSTPIDELINDYNNNMDSSRLEGDGDSSKVSAVSAFIESMQANIGRAFSQK